jgi:hypothetical protein
MGEAKRKEQIRGIVHAIITEWADKGMLIEGGFRSMVAVAYDQPETITEAQMADMRRVFFAGAQHLFASLIDALDPDNEPTDADMRKMYLIQSELDAFLEETRKYFGLPPEPRGTAQ